MPGPVSMRICNVASAHVLANPGPVLLQRIRASRSHNIAFMFIEVREILLECTRKKVLPLGLQKHRHGRETEECGISHHVIPWKRHVPDPHAEHHEIVGETIVFEAMLGGEIFAAHPHVSVYLPADASMESFDAVPVEAGFKLQRTSVDEVRVHGGVLTIHLLSDNDVTFPSF